MARTATAEKPEESKEVIKSGAAALPAGLADKMKADQGKGLSTDQEDNLVPLIYILQSQSPVVQKGNASRIEGAEAGDFWLRNASEPIVSGEKGMLFQPCFFTKDWIEWIPDRGGFVGRHDTLPADAKKTVDPNNENKVSYLRDNGNEVVETRHHVGFVISENGAAPLPYILPLSSTGHSFSRSWMFMMNSKTLPDGTKVPSWGCLYRLKTKLRTNAQGSWYAPMVEDAGYVETVEAYERGAALYQAFSSGAKKAEAPAAVEGAPVEGAASDDKDEIPF